MKTSLIIRRVIQATLGEAPDGFLDRAVFNFSGHDAQFIRDFGLDLDAGSFTLTGNQATLPTSLTFSADAGSFTLTGNDASTGSAPDNSLVTAGGSDFILTADGDYIIVESPAAAAFSPADLFAASEDGAWYDPSDLSTVWTDTAGTTQAGVGDAVARIDDKSGNGYHLLQATAASRPILRQDGSSNYYLEFDGVDDDLESSVGFGITGSQNRSIFAAASSGDQGETILGTGNNSATGARVTVNPWPLSADDIVLGFSGGNVKSTSMVSTTANYVAGFILDGTTFGDWSLRLDGASASVSAYTNPSVTMATASDTIVLGADYANVVGAVDVYGIVINDTVISGTDLSNLEAWLADKSGVTL